MTRPGPAADVQGHGRAVWTAPALVAGGLALAVYLFYFAAYPLRHLRLPMGFDPPWYVWRAEYTSALPLGPGGTSARPGHAILSSLLGAVTGRSQLELAVVLSMVFVPMLALAVGAFARAGLGTDRLGWALTIAATGAVIGPTHLVGENLATMLQVILVVAALVAMASRLRHGRGFGAATALLLASGLAHWDFLFVAGVALALAALLALRTSVREHREGLRWIDTETGLIVGVGAASLAALGVVIAGVLRAPLKTTDLPPDPLLYSRKFRTDLARLAIPGVAGLAATPLVRSLRIREGENAGLAVAADPGLRPAGPVLRAERFSLWILEAWTYVMAAGIGYGLAANDIPPARFLALLVALPGAAAVGLSLRFGLRWWNARPFRSTEARLRTGDGSSARPAGRGRAARTVAGGVVALAVATLAVPGALRWYRYPVLMNATALRQAQTAAGYVQTLPPGRPVVFLVSYEGTPGSYAAVVKEREIRIGLSPSRKLDAHVFVGNLADLLAGRPTPAPDPRTGGITNRYWLDVRPVLGTRPPVLVLEAMAEAGFAQALAMGADLVAPGVAVLQAPGPPSHAVAEAPPPNVVPSLPGGVLIGAVLLALLALSGAGWAWALLGPRAGPEVLVSMAPLTGAAALMIGGLVATKAGVRPGGAAGVAVFVLIGLAGYAAALMGPRPQRRGRS
jgi:hypothetical protein